MPLEPILVELRIVEGAEHWNQAAQGSNQSELTGDVVRNKAKPHFSS
jgi:hypothetical protein